MEKIKSILLASNNIGKIRELTELLDPFDIEIIPQSNFGITSIEETGLTFIENAILKARYACEVSGLPAIADDSGLVVDALEGAPGIYSARYAGAKATDASNMAKLLAELRGIPPENRSAHYICVIVYLRSEKDPSPIICQGQWDGSISLGPKGDQGFGYDPIFYVPTHQCSAAELSLSEKNRISHRGQAMRRIVDELSRQVA